MPFPVRVLIHAIATMVSISLVPKIPPGQWSVFRFCLDALLQWRFLAQPRSGEISLIFTVRPLVQRLEIHTQSRKRRS